MKDVFSIYSPANRGKLLLLSFFLVATVALIDWQIEPYISIGFLYLFPIMVVGGLLSRAQIVAVALGCAVLQEAFSHLPQNEAIVRLVLSSTGFVGTGLFVAELIHTRRMAHLHVEELAGEVKLRQDAEEQLRVLIESSPAAIVTIDVAGKILLANEAAQQLLAPEGEPLQGQAISSYLPALQTVIQTEAPRAFRTALQCRGQRSEGPNFLAGVWFSTYTTLSGPRLAAIVVDLSEELRDREDLSLDHLLKNSRILMGAMAHEIRNLCSAILVVHKNLSRIKELEHSEDFHALGTLIQSLEKISILERGPSPVQNAAAVELTSTLDEIRVLIDTAYHESAMEVQWQVPEGLPIVWADRYGLVQVFLNLAKNSQRAMQSTPTKRLCVTASEENHHVVIRFEDTGIGIASPENLFRPFQRGANGSSGLGLYVSRAIMRSFGGDLIYEPRSPGCCFAIVLPELPAKDTVNA
jgi:two-component system, LuxR family, sensor kinase FixL